jgi:uncharacterized protein
MRLSAYNKLVPHQDGTILFNLVSGALVLLTDRTEAEYRRLMDGDYSNVSLVNTLRRLGFVVGDVDERMAMREKYEEIINNCKVKNLYIVVTDRCNLGCHYCYEDKTQWIRMDERTQEQVKKFGVRFLTETPTEYFGIGWYGGEPTMNIPAIENLSSFFGDFCREHGITFFQMMVTNGTTFTDAMAERLVVDLGIRKMQITIDGFKPDHDRNRPFLTSLEEKEMSPVQIEQRKKLNPRFTSLPVLGQPAPRPKIKSSYDVIMANLDKLISRGALISLRMNVDRDSIRRVEFLLDELYAKGYFQENERGGILYAYAAPIFDGGCGSNKSHYKTMTKQEFSEEVSRIRDWYKRHSIPFFDHHNQMKFTGDTCTANKRWEYVINPDGTLTKCWHHAAQPEHAIGHVADEHPFVDFRSIKGNTFHQFNPFTDPECYNCEVLPVCMGGCKANNKVNEGNKQYEAGCTTTRFALTQEIKTLYELRRKSPA